MNTLPDGRRCFEDLAVGERFDLGPRRMDEAEVVEFARAFDPQPMHLDRAAGAASPLGGLAASGWHSCAVPDAPRLRRLDLRSALPRQPRRPADGMDGAGSGGGRSRRDPAKSSACGRRAAGPISVWCTFASRCATLHGRRHAAADWWIIVERAGRETPAEAGRRASQASREPPVPNPDSRRTDWTNGISTWIVVHWARRRISGRPRSTPLPSSASRGATIRMPFHNR